MKSREWQLIDNFDKSFLRASFFCLSFGEAKLKRVPVPAKDVEPRCSSVAQSLLKTCVDGLHSGPILLNERDGKMLCADCEGKHI